MGLADHVKGDPRVGDMMKDAVATAADDAWAHRSEGMRCMSCMWWVIKDEKYQANIAPGRQLGRCRRHAPTLAGFPAVWGRDWCGDHKIDEKRG